MYATLFSRILPSRLVQEETVKTGFYRMSDSDSDHEFSELKDLWYLACLECVVVCCVVFGVSWSCFLSNERTGDC